MLIRQLPNNCCMRLLRSHNSCYIVTVQLLKWLFDYCVIVTVGTSSLHYYCCEIVIALLILCGCDIRSYCVVWLLCVVSLCVIAAVTQLLCYCFQDIHTVLLLLRHSYSLTTSVSQFQCYYCFCDIVTVLYCHDIVILLLLLQCGYCDISAASELLLL